MKIGIKKMRIVNQKIFLKYEQSLSCSMLWPDILLFNGIHVPYKIALYIE